MCQLLIKMAEIEERLAAGCVEKPQLAGLIAGFQIARDQVTVED
jgi:replication factor C subunit 3/5